MKRPIQMLTGAAFVLVAGYLVMGVSAARAGDTIIGPGPHILTDDTEMLGDIDCTGVVGDCIVFAAADITLTMNGFTITGPEPQPCADASGPAGVQTAGFPGADIKGPGKVTRFGVGIHINGSDDSRVREVVAIRNCLNGILVNTSDKVVIEENVVLNTFNIPTPCGGISISGNENQVAQNEVHDNGEGGGDYGIRVVSGSDNLIEENSVTRNHRGIVLFGSFTTVEANIVLNNKVGGIDIFDGGVGSTITPDNVCEVGTGGVALAVCGAIPTIPGFMVAHDVG